jgi:protein-tyrosine-phosphatase
VTNCQISSILLVCMGNTCRSPMAAGIMKRSIQERHNCGDCTSIVIRTAGLMAPAGMPVSAEACTVMREAGIDISQHQTTRLTAQLVDEADLILTMTDNQCRQLRERFPRKALTIQTLGRISESSMGDVRDPFGAGLEAYRQTYHELKRMVDRFVDKIVESK